ncbi:unnamed protein product [Meloidogyne enterolobii]|uniref:Uncharacterized protein n=1 Tax=Meloidogyne enterolobii TaxID=390850 RepID=A0ACB1AB72_MELEN
MFHSPYTSCSLHLTLHVPFTLPFHFFPLPFYFFPLKNNTRKKYKLLIDFGAKLYSIYLFIHTL